MTKAIECHYPTRASSNTGSKASTGAGLAIAAQNVSATLVTDPSDEDNRHEARNDGSALPQGEIALSNPEWEDFGGVSLDWDEQEFDFVDLLDPGRTVENSVLGTMSLGSALTPSMDQEGQRPQAFFHLICRFRRGQLTLSDHSSYDHDRRLGRKESPASYCMC